MAGSHASIPANPPHGCDKEPRIAFLESRMDAVGIQLTTHDQAFMNGQIEFASIKKDLAQIITNQSKVEATLITVQYAVSQPRSSATRLDKFWDACITWSAGSLILGVLWVVAKSGQIPGVHP